MSHEAASPRTDAAAGARPHLAALDGVRGLAITLVLFVHFLGDEAPHGAFERILVKAANYGIWGVDLFFVLSGFLITGILLDAKSTPHALRSFYVRRTLRIFPLYYGVLAVLFLVLPILPFLHTTAFVEDAHHQAYLWTYTSNLYLAWKGTWALPYVSHFWSLAVEEHFYLVWPIVVLTLAPRALLKVCVGVSLFALVLRCVLSWNGVGDVALVTLTPCRLDALCIGGFLAVAVRHVGLPEVVRLARPTFLLFPLLVLALSVWHLATGGLFRELVLPIRGTLVALTFGGLIVAAVSSPSTTSTSRVLRSRTLCFLGKYSYGLYVFHGVVAFAQQDHALVSRLSAVLGSHLAALLLSAALGATISLLLAIASYQLFEKWFLRLKDKLAPTHRPVRAPSVIEPTTSLTAA